MLHFIAHGERGRVPDHFLYLEKVGEEEQERLQVVLGAAAVAEPLRLVVVVEVVEQELLNLQKKLMKHIMLHIKQYLVYV